jgi:hypothetical protein
MIAVTSGKQRRKNQGEIGAFAEKRFCPQPFDSCPTA